MKLGDYLKAINTTKEPLMDSDDQFIERDYEMNVRSSVDKKMQFDFLSSTIRKGRRYSPWIKETLPDDIEIVKEYFNYSNKKAKEALDVLTDGDIVNIKNKLSKGGKI